MNRAVNIKNNTYWIGVNDRETDIFESLWPLPEGVSYNSYLIKDEKVALIDTVRVNYSASYIKKIKNILGDKSIDYLIINHMEPDHSGSIKAIKSEYPEIKIVGNKKTLNYLQGFYGIEEDTLTVDDGEELDLGNRKLKFYLTPMVHWPETMMTYDVSENMLFSGDAFGSFGAFNGGIFDNEVNYREYEDETRRYFSNIVARYSPLVLKAINRLADLDIEIIAPTHGLVWKDNPEHIINKYSQWSNYQGEDGVVIIYGSMYGNTAEMAEEIGRGLIESGIDNINIFDSSRTDLSYLLSQIWKYNTVIIGSCTYNTEMFPPINTLTNALENRNLKNKQFGIFGSYSWSGGAIKSLREFSDNLNLELIEPVIEARFAPGTDVFSKCRVLAENIAESIKN